VHAVLAARTDRLPPAAKHLLQIAAVLGMQMTEPLLQAVMAWTDVEVHTGLQQLQAGEFLYETRVVPVRTYRFKHALTQEVAYQSLLTRSRQQYHQRTAQILVEHFPDLTATQPEVVAQHYTAAGLPAEALPYWQRAGQLALQRSATLDAERHLTTALELLATLPDTPERAQKELDLQVTLGPVLMVTRGQAAPEVQQTYARALALCQQLGDTPQRFATLWGLQRFYRGQGAYVTARELGEQLVQFAERAVDPRDRQEAHDALGMTLFFLGDYAAARAHLEQGSVRTDPAQRDLVPRQGEAPGVRGLAFVAQTLWCLGFPAQAVQRSREALAQAQALAHPYSLAFAQYYAARLHHRLRDIPAVQALAEALLTLATAEGFAFFVDMATCWQGWVLAVQSHEAAGLAQLRRGMAGVADAGHTQARPLCLTLLVEAAGQVGQVEDGLRLLAEARTVLEANGQGDLLAETYRLHGALLLRQAVPDVAQAETCFRLALAVARRQQAKSWDLRAATSLSGLWQHQGKRAAAYDVLAPVYGWFTEGFGTADLQEARALLNDLRA
jgi:predicted ATPase